MPHPRGKPVDGGIASQTGGEYADVIEEEKRRQQDTIDITRHGIVDKENAEPKAFENQEDKDTGTRQGKHEGGG